MRKPYRIILIVSALLTAFLFVQDWIHDKPSGSYSVQQIIGDIVVVGSMYTGLFFAGLSAVYFLISGAIKLTFKKK